jgi:hypothetical protein
MLYVQSHELYRKQGDSSTCNRMPLALHTNIKDKRRRKCAKSFQTSLRMD